MDSLKKAERENRDPGRVGPDSKSGAIYDLIIFRCQRNPKS